MGGYTGKRDPRLPRTPILLRYFVRGTNERRKGLSLPPPVRRVAFNERRGDFWPGTRPWPPAPSGWV